MAFLSEKLISASGGVQEETDDEFNLVTGLYNFDGSNGAQNNTFTGVGPSGASQSWTRNNSPTQGSFSPFSSEVGKWSIEFNGSGYCSSATSNDFQFGTGDYTIEAFLWKNTQGQQHVFDGRWPDNNERILFYVNSSDKLAANIDGSDKGAATSDFPLNQWVHVALVRSGTTGYLFQNGSQVATWTGDSVDIEKPPYSVFFGRDSYGSNYYWNGFMSNIRVLKGTAAYTGSSYSVPTSPLTAITNTKLLTARMNRFKDSSASAHVMTNNGIGVTPFSPFAPSAAYDAAVNGGSGSFTRSNEDNISATSSNHAIGTSDFTIECWCYLTDGGHSYGNGVFAPTTGVVGPALGQWNNTGWQIYHGTSSTNLTNTGFKKNEWVHVALVRASNVLNLYQNGVKVTSDISDSTNYTNTGFNIGWYYGTVYAWDGFISNFKMCLNAIYTSAFTPPTALVTPTSGGSSAASTKILVDFTNAGIIDSSQKTNVQTVNNAQLDTSVKKFGTASLELDGTGDYLTYPLSSFIEFGASDWTIECFVNVDAVSTTYKCIYSASYGIQFYVYNNQLHLAVNDTDNISGYMISANSTAGQISSAGTWYHVAAYRLGSAFYCSVDGAVTAMGTSSATVASPSLAPSIGIWGGQSLPMDGYIDELRITRKARYGSSNFTAPTKEFPNL